MNQSAVCVGGWSDCQLISIIHTSFEKRRILKKYLRLIQKAHTHTRNIQLSVIKVVRLKSKEKKKITSGLVCRSRNVKYCAIFELIGLKRHSLIFSFDVCVCGWLVGRLRKSRTKVSNVNTNTIQEKNLLPISRTHFIRPQERKFKGHD